MTYSFRMARAAACAVFLLVSFNVFAQQTSAQTTHGIAIQNLDRSVKPGDDFFRFANGDWLKRTEIPPDRPAVGVFSELGDRAIKQTQGVVEDATKANAPSGANTRKIADLYKSYMDETGIEKKGLEPIQSRLKAIAAIKDKVELAQALGESLRTDVDPLNNTNFHTANLFGIWVAPGFEDPDRYTPYLLQGGLTLPDREYYLSNSEHMKNVRTKFHAHVVAMLKLAGLDQPEMRASRIVELEHAIAEKHESLSENMDIHKANNSWTQADFTAKAPGLDWAEYFRGAGLTGQQKFVVWQPAAFTGESALVASIPLDTWKDWLSYHLIEQYGSVLPKALADERFAFFGKTLSGASQQRPRWQRGVITVTAVLGDAVGQIYAKRYFSPQAKAEAEAMVTSIIEAFRKRIDALTWMAPQTKAEAKAKLSTLYVGIGYPETWRDYSKLQISPDDIFENLWRASLFEYHRNVDRLGRTVNRKEWSMTNCERRQPAAAERP